MGLLMGKIYLFLTSFALVGIGKMVSGLLFLCYLVIEKVEEA